MLFDVKDTGATSSFGGLLCKEGKPAKLQRLLVRLLHCLICSY